MHVGHSVGIHRQTLLLYVVFDPIGPRVVVVAKVNLCVKFGGRSLIGC